MTDIKKVNIADEFEDSFIRYAMSVITDRALPDIRDGFKPVHRRIIYGMLNNLSLKSTKPYVKSARVIGEVMGTLHPHGDSSIYEAACRMALSHAMRYPLVDGQGSFGSIDGDGAAASRYTEMKPTRLMEYMIRGIKSDAVDMRENFSQDMLEPTVLPSIFPNILCNPSSGIAVGMACNMAPHNLGEVCDAAIDYIKKDGNITLDEVMTHIVGPDFPLGGIIINPADIKKAYASGKSSTSLKIRANYTVKGDKIIFTSIPYGATTNKIKEQITNNVNELSSHISDFNDNTNKDGIKLEFTAIDESKIDEALALIFKYTKLQNSFSINNVCLVDNKPKQVGLIEILSNYVDFLTEMKIRISKFNINKLEKAVHVLEGLIIAYLNIDEVIKIIRSSDGKAEARLALENAYNLDEVQANAILDRKLSTLTKLDEVSLKTELSDKQKEIEMYNKIITDKETRNSAIIEDILLLKKNFADERRTLIKETKDFIAPKVVKEKVRVPMKIAIYADKVKKVKTSVAGARVIDTDSAEFLVAFTGKGMALKVPMAMIKDTFTTYASLFNTTEQILYVAASNEDIPIYQVTYNGMIKCSNMSEYRTAKSGISIKLNEGDRVISVCGKKVKHCHIVTTLGQICFEVDIREQGKATKGVKALKLRDGEGIVSVTFNKVDMNVMKKRGSMTTLVKATQL